MIAKALKGIQTARAKTQQPGRIQLLAKMANSSVRLEKLGRQRRSGGAVEVSELHHKRTSMLCGKECGHREKFEVRQQLI